jgi:hypothetical protein
MTNDECLMTKEFSNEESLRLRFGLPASSFVIRHLSFVQSSLACRAEASAKAGHSESW